MNIYATAADVRAALGETDTSSDAEYLRKIEAVSRSIDRYCRRHFYVESESRIFDLPRHVVRIWLPDFLSITTLELDLDMDQTFSEEVDDDDYLLYPQNDFPKMWIESAPLATWRSIVPVNQSMMQITGLWGHGDGESATPYTATSITGTVGTTTGTTLTLSADDVVEAGHTILVDEEQMYVSAVATLAATVLRGVNGTTAATQATAAVSIYKYPADVVDVAIRATMRKAIRDSQGEATAVKIGVFSESFKVAGGTDVVETSSGLSVSEEAQLSAPGLRRQS